MNTQQAKIIGLTAAARINKLQAIEGSILMLVAGWFDRWSPGASSEEIDYNVRIASNTTTQIVTALAHALALNPAVESERQWRNMVNVACRNITFDFSGERMIKVSEKRNYPSFVACVAETTEQAVAPPGSKWADRAVKRREQRQLEAVKSALRRFGRSEYDAENWLRLTTCPVGVPRRTV